MFIPPHLPNDRKKLANIASARDMGQQCAPENNMRVEPFFPLNLKQNMHVIVIILM
jgi:hypothetical protein